jgi:hypothetical protein
MESSREFLRFVCTGISVPTSGARLPNADGKEQNANSVGSAEGSQGRKSEKANGKWARTEVQAGD